MRQRMTADGTVVAEPNRSAFAAVVVGRARLLFGPTTKPSLEIRQAAEEGVLYEDQIRKLNIHHRVSAAKDQRTRIDEIEIALKVLDKLTDDKQIALEIPIGAEANFSGVMAGCAAAAARLVAPSGPPAWWPPNELDIFPKPTFVDERGYATTGITELLVALGSREAPERPGPLTILVDSENNAVWHSEFTAVTAIGLLFGNVGVAAQRGHLSEWPAVFAKVPDGQLIRQVFPREFRKQASEIRRPQP